MKFNNDFKYDLEVGQVGEETLAHILGLDNKTIEVKTDFLAWRTGNVFIEYESRGHKSGIATSQADYWCFVLSSHQFALLTAKKMHDLAEKYYKDGGVNGGDNNTSKGVLVPVDALLKE